MTKPAPQTIYVDFANRGFVYTAPLTAFNRVPEIGDRFIGTDHGEFEHVLCEVIGYDKVRSRVFHRPVNPNDLDSA